MSKYTNLTPNPSGCFPIASPLVPIASPLGRRRGEILKQVKAPIIWDGALRYATTLTTNKDLE
ncbi:hypothetical protein [Nodularia sphaerocarpa]|uniref:hypothetical protein n=1 Tax=Nodularia sphaerocarpa TaxID=137816 RepID=UPI001EFB8465|nr:hypothetical protein [Nodularia sphaerocarpa]MDB9373479.1 hypothetical protein [Nodularia sphaerocarpa CS-585]MDB9377589.1 hypothetical protein [Nodularia sphaerocarpa CS-585A2]